MLQEELEAWLGATEFFTWQELEQLLQRSIDNNEPLLWFGPVGQQGANTQNTREADEHPTSHVTHTSSSSSQQPRSSQQHRGHSKTNAKVKTPHSGKSNNVLKKAANLMRTSLRRPTSAKKTPAGSKSSSSTKAKSPAERLRHVLNATKDTLGRRTPLRRPAIRQDSQPTTPRQLEDLGRDEIDQLSPDERAALMADFDQRHGLVRKASPEEVQPRRNPSRAAKTAANNSSYKEPDSRGWGSWTSFLSWQNRSSDILDSSEDDDVFAVHNTPYATTSVFDALSWARSLLH